MNIKSTTVITVAMACGLLLSGITGAAASGKSDNSSENSKFVDTWHGTGDGHQANNAPGDTAADRHNFDQAAAGKSGTNPVNK